MLCCAVSTFCPFSHYRPSSATISGQRPGSLSDSCNVLITWQGKLLAVSLHNSRHSSASDSAAQTLNPRAYRTSPAGSSPWPPLTNPWKGSHCPGLSPLAQRTSRAVVIFLRHQLLPGRIDSVYFGSSMLQTPNCRLVLGNRHWWAQTRVHLPFLHYLSSLQTRHNGLRIQKLVAFWIRPDSSHYHR